MEIVKLKAIKKSKTLVEKVVDQIQTLIVAGNLKSGDLLPVEYKLAKMLNIAQSTMREAIKILEGKGIVEVIPRKGIMVLPQKKSNEDMPVTVHISPERYLEFLDFFRYLAALVSVLGCEKRTDLQLKSFDDLFDEMEVVLGLISTKRDDLKNYEKWGDLHVRFYSLLGECAGNSIYEMIMKEVLEKLLEQGPLAEVLLSRDLELVRASLKMNKKLIRMIKERDAINAYRAAFKSMAKIQEIVNTALIYKAI